MAKTGRYILLIAIALFLAIATGVRADNASDVPPSPANYFNDYAHVVDAASAQQINTTLANFERQTSNQIVVAVYPSFPSQDDLGDYCLRLFNTWKVGQASHDNGAVLFVFVADHKMRIQTGPGIQGALPDITCARILDDVIKPHFRQGDYTAGLSAGVNAMIAATKGEFKGNGYTVQDRQRQQSADANSDSGNIGAFIWFAFIVIWIIISIARGTRGYGYSSSGLWRYGGFMLGNSIGNSIGSSFTNSGGGGGGGFSGGGGGGGFSGGGGSSDGGGASGSW